MNLRRSKRFQHVEPPPAINPITNRPYTDRQPIYDEQQEAEVAAGQRALATAIPPKPIAVGFDPRRSMWRGTQP